MDEATNDTMHDKGLGSQISFFNKDINGDKVDNVFQVERMRDWQTAKQFSNKERNRRHGFNHVHRIVSTLELSKPTRRDAAKIFLKAHNEELAVGHSLENIAIACVWIASRRSKEIRSPTEWENATGIKQSKMRMLVTLVQKELNVGYEPVTPMDYVSRILSDFDLTSDQRERVYKIVKVAEDNNIHISKKPQSVVSAALYISVDWLSQADAADKVGVAVVTLRNSLKEIESVL
jgi:transcription initiation factor TFIIB